MRSQTLLLVLSLTAAACGSATAETSNVQSAAAAQAVGQNSFGPVRAVADALSTVPLRGDQRVEIVAMLDKASARHKTVHEGHDSLSGVIAGQIESGTIDRKALEVAFASQKGQHDQVLADDRASMTRLHAVLSAEQRNQFVDALQTQLKKHHGGHHGMRGRHGGEGHEQGRGDGVDRDGRGDGEGKRGSHMMGGMMGHGMLGLGRDLNLDDDQKSKIRDVMKAEFEGLPAGSMGRDFMANQLARKEGLESFRTANFDAAKLLPDHPGMMQARMIGLAEKILPILKPEQRKLAAEKIRAHGKRGPMIAPKPEAPPAGDQPEP